MADVQMLGTSPKTTASIISTTGESSIGGYSGSSYSPAASQTALIPPPPHTAAPVIARDFSGYMGGGARPAVIGAASTPAYPHYDHNGAHEEKVRFDNHHHQHEETAGAVIAKHGHGQASSSSSTTAKMVRSLSGGNRVKEDPVGHTPVAVLHVPVLTRDGRLYGWNIVLPPSDIKPLPSADRKVFFVPASEEISKENMKAIHSVENDKEGRLKLYCRKTWMLDNYVVEAKIPGTH